MPSASGSKCGKALLRVEHRFGDPGIGAAAAEIAAHAFAHALRVIARLAFVDQADRAHDLAGRAEAALQSVMRDERRLHRMQLVAPCDALDGEDVGAVVAYRQRQAGIGPPPIDQHRAGAALAAVASLLGAGQVQTLAQEIEQRDAGIIEIDVPPHPVDGEADGEIHARAPNDAGDKSGTMPPAVTGRHVEIQRPGLVLGLALVAIYGGILRLSSAAIG